MRHNTPRQKPLAKFPHSNILRQRVLFLRALRKARQSRTASMRARYGAQTERIPTTRRSATNKHRRHQLQLPRPGRILHHLRAHRQRVPVTVSHEAVPTIPVLGARRDRSFVGFRAKVPQGRQTQRRAVSSTTAINHRMGAQQQHQQG